MDTLNNEAKLKGQKEIEETKAMNSSSNAENKKGLNPFAKEWDPVKDRAPEERRCLYLAFSSWYPFNEDEITFYFQQIFGRCCIEKLNVRWPQENNEDAMIFGKVVFHFSAIPICVLGKEDQVMLFVNSKSLWCLRLDPMNQNNEQSNDVASSSDPMNQNIEESNDVVSGLGFDPMNQNSEVSNDVV